MADSSLVALGERLRRERLSVAVAESCTGGLLGAQLTEADGASRFFVGGVITYTYEAKERLLGVPAELLERFGAVSPEVARLMAQGVRERLHADLGLAVTGVAGPDEQEGKPVGLVYVAASLGDQTEVREHHFDGGRASNREAAAGQAINLALAVLDRTIPSGGA